MTYTWGRLTGPQGDRPNPSAFAVPLTKEYLLLPSPLCVFDGTWTQPTVYRTQDGMCFMEGLIRRGDNAAFGGGTLLAVVPPGYRPNARTLLNSVSSADSTQLFTRIDVDPGGEVWLQQVTAAPVWLSLSGRWYVPVPLDVPAHAFPPVNSPVV